MTDATQRVYALRHPEQLRLAGKARRGVFIWGGGFGMFDLRIDTDGLDDIGRVYEEAGRQAPKIISRALNDTGTSAFAVVKRRLQEIMGAGSQKEVEKELRKIRATPSRLTFIIIGLGRPWSLKRFKPKQRKRGVSAKPWGVSRVFPGTFVPEALHGHVFKRVGTARLPIKKLWGPSVPKEMMDDAVFQALVAKVDERLPNRLLHHLGRALGK